ncbi:hypothetical protein [Roseiflexus castenholzii]|uniref:hypothetical protein n=1 Tax=Roseiflexus castenholzii TaxID=120962 RepID=UPI003C7AA193
MDEIEQWAAELDALMTRIGLRVARSEARARTKDDLKGLVRPTERKNGRQLAETVIDTPRLSAVAVSPALGSRRWT